MFLAFLIKITFEDRKVNNTRNTHLSVDCTDCGIQQKGYQFASFKFQDKSALHYDVTVGILMEEREWLNGPYQCKDWPDNYIFRDGLIKFLGVGERMEADDGYVYESPYKTKIPFAVLTCSSQEADAMQKSIQGQHETVNTCIKSFEILKSVCRHDPMQHSYDFQTAATCATVPLK